MGVRTLASVGWVALSLGCAASQPNTSLTADGPAEVTLPVVLHFASRDGSEVVDPAAVGTWLAHTQTLLRPHGIHLELVGVQPLPDGASAVRVIDRYRLLSQVDAHALHVMVVDELGGVRRDGDATVRGLHFWAPVLRSQYIALGPDATPTTMAHEIGHVYGLPHENDPANIMCSCDRTPQPTLTPAQGEMIRRGIAGD